MTATPPWEPSAWLRGAITNRLKQMAKAFALADGDTVVVFPLTDRPKGADAKIWEFACDRCGKYCPPGSGAVKLRLGSVAIQLQGVGPVHITVGLCDDCAAAEQLPHFEEHKP